MYTQKRLVEIFKDLQMKGVARDDVHDYLEPDEDDDLVVDKVESALDEVYGVEQ